MLNKAYSLISNELKTLQSLIRHRIYVSPKSEREVVNSFHKLYYNAITFDRTWGRTFWLGIPTLKCPLDLWIYQEMIQELRPDVVIESGTAYGGSALFLACICDMINYGRVITIDIEEKPNRPNHKRINYILGSSTSAEVADYIVKQVCQQDKVMVILDSDHRKEHVLNELNLYSRLVSVGSYIIVEDTNVNGHPVEPEFGPGPGEAVEAFLKANNEFKIDRSREKFYMTFNPGGYLKRVR